MNYQYTINIASFNKLEHVYGYKLVSFKDWMTIVMITYCECKKISNVLQNQTNIKADSIMYADKLYS